MDNVWSRDWQGVRYPSQTVVTHIRAQQRYAGQAWRREEADGAMMSIIDTHFECPEMSEWFSMELLRGELDLLEADFTQSIIGNNSRNFAGKD